MSSLQAWTQLKKQEADIYVREEASELSNALTSRSEEPSVKLPKTQTSRMTVSR
ncbi:hypothetical protein Vi05172_g2308 [Venturia inaequalis]|nr:hypothetical protein Vi05172_g2308 [Venturia inaequalis]